MSLYTEWTDMVVEYVKTKGEAAFWKEYGAVEKNIYTKILANHTKEISGKLEDLANDFNTSTIFFMGFIDGVNDSLINPLDLEAIDTNTELNLAIDFDKLYFNMLDAKADYLYTLPQWEAVFSPEKRKEIRNQWKESKVIVNNNKVGRNDACPCGSGKKYKKCCGKEA
ncbi:preprotein translocase subunit SecA [Clostridium pascui]|uniref:SEC-C metal-binding domain-containing protein n=1 Tax=Clostridium pascui TaxID=46609 RepID=UPI00195D08E8|nr:SEC-C metal-binding domain-containing protein [Clostridium pascui]MBM7871962.1 preprotein translocase subunit SecA [Clostridium pascui]